MEPLSHFSYGESNQGVYGHSMGVVGHANIEVMKDRILQAVDSIPVSPKEDAVFTMADYGTADGYTTMPLVKEIIGLVRKKHGEIPIQVVYEDQISSDFNSLFRWVHGLFPNPSCYLNEFKQVFVMASGTSFFKQILPDSSAHLIMSFMAAHYLSKPATKFQNSLQRYPDATEEERQLVEAQAAEDWETFLLHRARELKSGGMLVVALPADDPEMKVDGMRFSCQGFEEGMLRVWRQMRDEGKITQEEFLDTNFYRNMPYLREVTAPFDDPNSKVTRAGLSLCHAETVHAPCVELAKWKRKLNEEGVDDRANWAKDIVNQNKVWSFHVFIRALSSTRSAPEKEAVVDELYERLENEFLAQDPRESKNGFLMNCVFVRKF
ncbi:uncharacterized protein LOC143287405 [Babylonia areolata]|uniref:uncharacterized protein LOC143287405 n=1 Tax=Babylonia areolata TaxID=304850 RepID=UPI003FD164C2